MHLILLALSAAPGSFPEYSWAVPSFSFFVPFCGQFSSFVLAAPWARAQLIPDSAIELIDFIGRRADVLQQTGEVINRLNVFAAYEMESFRLADPWTRVRLGIGDRPVQFQCVVVGSVVALLQAHRFAVRISEMIDPCAFIVAGGIHHERISLPVAYGISPPSGLVRLVGELAAIRVDRTNAVAPHEVLVDSTFLDNELDRIRIDQRSRHAHRITVLIRICSVRRWNGSAPANMFFRMRGSVGSAEVAAVGWLVRIEHLLSQRREWRHVVAEAAIAAIRARSAPTIS